MSEGFCSKFKRFFSHFTPVVGNSYTETNGTASRVGDCEYYNVDNLFPKVKEVLQQISKDADFGETEITMDSSIIDDLGFVSLTFVDLTLGLEEALGIDEFPMQEWIDDETLRKNKRFTVRSLVLKSAELISSP